MADPILTRVRLATYKNKATGDTTQVPAAATVEFFRPGVTATASTTIPATTIEASISVNDSTLLAVGETIRVGTDGASLVIDGIVSTTEITVSNSSSSSVSIASGVRLMRLDSRPRLYNSRGGALASSSSLTTDALNGRATAYLLTNRFDYTSQVSGESKRIGIDAAGGKYSDEVVWNDVRDFSSVQGAIDALPENGGVVFLPAGIHLITAGLQINRGGVTLQGEGIGTILRAQSSNSFDLLTVNATHCRIRELVLDGQWASSSAGSYSCLVMNGLGASGNLVLETYLENVTMLAAPKHGLHLVDMILVTAVNCEFVFCGGDGVRISTSSSHTGITNLRFLSCVMSVNSGRGLRATPDGSAFFGVTNLSLIACGFQGNKSGLVDTEGNAIEVNTSIQTMILGCYFEQAGTAPVGSSDRRAQQMVSLSNCPTVIVDGCTFQGNADSDSPFSRMPHRAIAFFNSPFFRLTNCTVQDMATEFAHFSSDSHEGIEFGNRDLDSSNGRPRFSMDGNVRIVGMSRAALGLPIHGSDSTRPGSSDTRAGSVLWNTSPSAGATNLQVWDSGKWQSTPLEPAAVSLTGQTAAIDTTTLLTSPQPGLYLIETCFFCSHVANGGIPKLDVVIGFTDDMGSTSVKAVDAFPLNTTGRRAATNLIRVSSGNVTFAVAIDLDPIGTIYALYIRVINLG